MSVFIVESPLTVMAGTRSEGQLLLPGVSTSLRRLFAKMRVNEPYGDFHPVVTAVKTFAFSSIQVEAGGIEPEDGSGTERSLS